MLLLVALSACGGPGVWQGKVGGESFDLQNAIFVQRNTTVTFIDSGKQVPDSPVVDLLLSDSKTLCQDVKAQSLSAAHAYVRATLIEVSRDNSSFTPPAIGAYHVLDPNAPSDAGTGGANTMLMVFYSKDCGARVDNTGWAATSGNFAMNAIDSQAGGTAAMDIVNVSFGAEKDIITGKINATYCDDLAGLAHFADFPQAFRRTPCQ